jgi:hypothetical protein
MYDLGPDTLYGTPDDDSRGAIKISEGENHAIYGNNILYKKLENFRFHLMIHNAGTDGIFGTLDDSKNIVVSNPSGVSTMHAKIYKNKVVWSNGSHVYIYDLGQDEKYGTADDGPGGILQYGATSPNVPGGQLLDVDGNKIVFQDQYGYIWMYDLGPNGIFENGLGDDRRGIRVATRLTAANWYLGISGKKVTYDNYNHQKSVHEIHLVNVNSKPQLTAPAEIIGRAGQTITFTISGSDIDGDLLDFSSVDLPFGATLVNNGNNTATFSWKTRFSRVSAIAEITFETDDGELSDSKVVTITVRGTSGGGKLPSRQTIPE